MKTLLPLAFLLLTAPVAFFAPARAQSTVSSERVAEQLRFSSHALQRMSERGVSREQVLSLVAHAKPFRYFHQRQWKLGYFDPSSGLFVATSGGVVITVFTDATPRYVERLKRARP